MSTIAPDGGPPWLMWGTSEELILTTESAAVMGGIVSQQLANVDLRHPTNWTILVAVTQVVFSPVVDPMGVQVNFNIRFGVGRSVLDFAPVVMQWGNAELQPDGIGDQKVLTEFPVAPLVPAGPANLVRKFPAQSIQIGADLRSLVAMGPGTTIRAQVTTFCAPITHVRPDWFLGHMAGGETNGR
jgi:hypothetical protein